MFDKFEKFRKPKFKYSGGLSLATKILLMMTMLLDLAQAATLTNLAVDIDNLLINAKSKLSISGTTDFVMKAGDCLRVTYNQPYKLSKTTYEA